MANLLNNKEDLKANFSGIDANFNWESIKSFVEDVERDIIAETIGDDALGYFRGNLTGLEGNPAKALQLLRRSVAYLSMLRWSQTALFRFTDKALYVSKSTDGAIISDKKLRDLRNHCEEAGFNYLDKAIAIMESNLESFPSYSDSGVRQNLLKGFIKTAHDFSLQRSINNSRITFLSMSTIMLDIQEEYLPNVMGADYYEEIKEKYLDGDLNSDEKKLLPLIKKAVALLTVAQACKDLPIKLSDKGLFINRYNSSSDFDQADPAAAARAQYLSDDHQDKGQRKLAELQAYLIKNVADLPGYISPATNISSHNDEHSGTYIF